MNLRKIQQTKAPFLQNHLHSTGTMLIMMMRMKMKKMMKSLTEVMKRMRSNRMRIFMMRKMTTNLRKRTIILKKMRTSKRMIIIYLLASQEIISLMLQRHQPQLRKTKAIREMKTRKRGQRSHDLVILEEILMRFKLCL